MKRRLMTGTGILLLIIGWSGWLLVGKLPVSSSLDRYLSERADEPSPAVMVSLRRRVERSRFEIRPLLEAIRQRPYVKRAHDPISLSERLGISPQSVVNGTSLLKQTLPLLNTVPLVKDGGDIINGLYRLKPGAVSSLTLLRDFESLQKQLLPDGWTMSMSGEPIVNGWLTRESMKTRRLLLPLLVGLGALVVLLYYRSWRVLVGLGILVSSSVGSTVLWMWIAGYPSDLLSVLAPMLVMIIALASGIHFLNEFYRATGPCRKRLRDAFHRKWKPALFCHATTAVGFGALGFSDIPAVRAMGVTVFLGIAMMSLIYFLAFPWVVGFLDPPDRQWFKNRNPELGFLLDNRTAGGTSLVLLAAVLLEGGWGAGNLRYETRALAYFRSDHPVRQGFQNLTKQFLPPRTGTVTLHWEKPGMSPDAKTWARWKRDLESLPGVRALLLPGERNQIRGSRGSVKTASTVLFFVDFQGMGALRELRGEVLARTRDRFPGLKSVGFGGIVDRIFRAQQSLKWTLTVSLIVSGLIIFGSMFLVVPNKLLFLPVCLVNVFPLAAVLVLMQGLGSPLSAATIIVFSILLGLAVNDTIHIVYGLDSKGTSVIDSLNRQFRPVLMTSLVLAGGFLVFALRDFLPVHQVGLFTASGVFFALLGDFVVLPGLCRRVMKQNGALARGLTGLKQTVGKGE